MQAEIKEYNGKPVLFIDGQPDTGLSASCGANIAKMKDGILVDYQKAGLHINSLWHCGITQ